MDSDWDERVSVVYCLYIYRYSFWLIVSVLLCVIPYLLKISFHWCKLWSKWIEYSVIETIDHSFPESGKVGQSIWYMNVYLNRIIHCLCLGIGKTMPCFFRSYEGIDDLLFPIDQNLKEFVIFSDIGFRKIIDQIV